MGLYPIPQQGFPSLHLGWLLGSKGKKNPCSLKATITIKNIFGAFPVSRWKWRILALFRYTD
jgi:hypothetical protein